MKQKAFKTITVPLDEELAYTIERTMIDLGLDSRGQAAAALIRSGAAAVPEAAFFQSVLQDALKQLRRQEADVFADFYEERARLLRTR